MKRLTALAVTCVTALAPAALFATPAGAITKGEKANHPALVQIHIFDKEDGTPHRCTGTALTDEWILSAAHCVEGESHTSPDVSSDVLKVYHSNDKKNPGPAEKVDRFVKHKNADIVLLHLATPHKSAHMKVSNGPSPRPGQRLDLYGFGKGFQDAEVNWLHKAVVEVKGLQDHISAGQVIEVKGITGASNHGDSGGPMVNDKGELVGVNVIGSHGIWADPYSDSKAVDTAAYRDWIKSVAGV
ncbi:S1 family peptidase [Dermatophilus congolensis]|uniref:Uncharacterized peptidase cgR_1176 n=1 Tax=Dermatophilus congolensis TaxID=1863 RepID=A0A239V639_9MICO|nr:S1 family peptidase [Dermatophilus congolensis]MBO3130319.1 S1 family peptidase [Dermatophilus congolensis]MBO3131050.1 S1 family peptidase [Dermatophilus congolensis]MBO3134790.1 S1 family peptidase [Dermatophilus congolensis]MBO3137026.1 S1 family peptidase [Dermatophilus congolensis]MBO3139271.1 S1 family peptidase [Dermatophilus congolensis]